MTPSHIYGGVMGIKEKNYMLTMQEAEILLKTEYNLDNFYLLADHILPDLKKRQHEIAFNSKIFISVKELGISNQCNLTIYEVILAHNTQNRRIAITKEMFRLLKEQAENNALVAFVTQDFQTFRLSLLTSEYKNDPIVNIIKTFSNPKRYSYKLGYGTKSHTAYKFLIQKGKTENLEELIKRFSVEEVNNDFYKKIAEKYSELITLKNGKRLLEIYGTSEESKYQEFAVRLIGRIMFCWFLKEKKSDANISLIPENILCSAAVYDKNPNYYHAVLEPLFFEILNTEHDNRYSKFKNDKNFQDIPFLNGGLFTPHLDDRYKFDEILEQGKSGQITIPNSWFKSFFEILEQYNFTVDENSSYDIELSIDPEMLGRIFEHLLSEYIRKQTGSFYTPREIVDFMVDSSLCEYLKEKTNIKDNKLQGILSWEDDVELDDNEKKKIINALCSLKILDPACGSGAFPIGILQKIVYILQEIDPDSNLWFDKVMENADDFIKREFRKKFDEKALDYIRKLGIIRNSIYGLDIQTIAIEISRLRCFLSLIIDEKVNDNEKNRGIIPLPNLEMKFLSVDSLGWLDEINIHELDLFPELKSMREELLNIRTNVFFNESSKKYKQELIKKDQDLCKKMQDFIIEKKLKPNENKIRHWYKEIERLKKEIKELQPKDISKPKQLKAFGKQAEQLPLFDKNNQTKDTLKKYENDIKTLENYIKKEKDKEKYHGLEIEIIKITSWNPYDPSSTTDWFDVSWMFGDDASFDIVIGNPPYEQLSDNAGYLADKYSYKDDLQRYENESPYETFKRAGDIYCLFYEKGLDLLLPNGILCYITSNKWMRAGYGEPLRNFLAYYYPLLLIDLGANVFENASVDTNILLIQKVRNQQNTIAVNVKDKKAKYNLKRYIEQNRIISNFNSPESWVILTPIEKKIKKKIEAVGTPLKDWDITINRGVLTGFKEAFIISGEKRAELIKQDPKSEEIIKPILRGRDIKRYGYEFADMWLINAHNGVKEIDLDPINIDDYPAIKKHLDKYYNSLKKRQDKGNTPYNLRNCAYLMEFQKPKIVYPETTHCASFSFDNGLMYIEKTCFMLISINAKYLQAILSSKLYEIAYKSIFSSIELGSNGYQYNKHAMMKLPIIKPTSKTEKLIERLLEDKNYFGIDSVVYQLYGLTAEEIEYIENKE